MLTNKGKYIFLLFIMILVKDVLSQSYNMNNTAVNSCSGTFYDSGGSGSNYSNNQNFTKTFCSANGDPIYFNFTSFFTEDSFDFLYIYDGNNSSAPLIGVYTGTQSPGLIEASGTCLTFVFESDGIFTDDGWSATIGCGTPPPPNSCTNPNSFCSQPITYPAGTNNGDYGPAGPDYDCLIDQPNGAWFNMLVQTAGPMNFTISAASDIDFVLWGPFTSATQGCLAGLNSTKVVDCSYELFSTETPSIPNAQIGEYYVMYITNYSNNPQNITFSQTSGVGSANCDILCNITNLTGTAGACDVATNTYNLSGTLTTTAPPTTGNLTISSSCGGTPFVATPPFASSINYTVTGIPADGAACTITATYSSDATCTRTLAVTSPGPCSTCTLSASNTGPYCEGVTIDLTATAVTGATGYTWAGPNGYTGTGQSVSIASSTTSMNGTYTVTATVPGGNCTATTSVIVTATPTVTVNSETICVGSSATLTANGATTYTWAPATGLSATTGATVTANPTVTTTYVITGTTSGCVDTESSTVTVTPSPTITVNSETICSGDNTTLTAAGATTYAWSPATGLNTTSGASVVSTATATTIYTITGIENGCSATATATVTVNQSGTLTVNSASYCEGGSATLTVSGATNYTWSPATGLSATTGDVVTANPTSTTVYTIIGTSAGCSSTGSATVTVNSNPTIDAGLNDTVCLGSTTALLATGAFSYVWDNDPSLSSTTIASPTVTPTATTTYTVTGTDINGCVGTDQVTIIVPPTFSLTPSSTPLTCFGASNGIASVTASGAGPFANYEYLWSNGATTQTINNLSANTYSVSVADLASCTQSTSVVVTEPGLLTIAESSNNPVSCNAGNTGSASVTANGGSIPYTYMWLPVGTTTSANNSLSAGNYTISVNDLNGCIATTTITITEPQAITLNPITGNTICIGQNTNLTASANGGAGGYVFLWTDGTNSFNGNIINVSPTTTTSYTVSSIDANGCPAASTETVTVNVNPPLNINFIPSSLVCEGISQDVNVSGSGGNGTYTFSWNPTTGITSLSSDGSAAVLTPSITTNYTVNIYDNCGTPAADTNFVITVTPKPILSITPAITSGCQPLEVEFTGTSNTIAVQCYWDFGDNSSSQNCNPTRIFAEDGNYTVTYSVTDINGCSSFANSTVVVFPVPKAVFLASPQPTTIIDPEITFTNITEGNIVNQTWFFNDSLGTSSTLPTPSYIYQATGEYFVTLAVETDKGCVDTTTQSIRIDDYYVIYIPNSFTPDGDGINETFTAYGNGIIEFKMAIYDRWGGKIMETDDINKGWDGKKNERKVEKGVYIYRIEAVNFLGERKLLSGHVNLVR